MGVEKDGNKSGGGYVGGFFQLFDWTAKSRKKLFSSKSDLPEHSKQRKRCDGNLPMTYVHSVVDEDEPQALSSVKGGSDYSCASSVADDDGYGARAPGVVAKLMGLDSMPISNSSEPYSTPFSDTRSLQDACFPRKDVSCHDRDFTYSGLLLNKVEGPVRKSAEPKPQRSLNKPIERFQTEMLPPKSAKSIPITHHKMLSPIKSHAFIPSKNAAHIMEAAARIIEPSPQPPPKAKISLVGSSSVPIKLRHLREKAESARKMAQAGSPSVPLKVTQMKDKVEAANKSLGRLETSRRPAESNAVKQLNGQSLNRSWNGPAEASSFRASNHDDASSGLKNKNRSVSLAIQAKVNVQKREGLSSGTKQGLAENKEWNEASLSQQSKGQLRTTKNVHKKSSAQTANCVLRPNNQKQNSVFEKERTSSKSLASHSQSRKVLTGDASSVRDKTAGRTAGNLKTGSRKFSTDLTDGEKGISYSDGKNFPRKKRLIDGKLSIEKNQAFDNIFSSSKQKAVQSKTPSDKQCWVEDSKNRSTDVISFTFTTPLGRSMPYSEAFNQVEQKDNHFMDNRGKRTLLGTDVSSLSSVGHNVIGGDVLSLLLEQKLKELSHAVETSQSDPLKSGSPCSFVSNIPDFLPAFSPAGTTSRDEKRDQYPPTRSKFNGAYGFDFSFDDRTSLGLKHRFQGTVELKTCSSSSVDVKKLLDCRQPSPISILEPAFSTESCNSSDTAESCSIDGCKQCSLVQAQEIFGLGPLKKFNAAEPDIDLSDSASTSARSVVKDLGSSSTRKKSSKTSNWELEYIQQILCNVEMMFMEFSLGITDHMINIKLFDQLEGKRSGPEAGCINQKFLRKLLFDCVSECLEVKCQRCLGGGHKTWLKGVSVVKRKERLAEEVYHEISSLRGLGNCMVDELVDKDMSSRYGRWLDFEVDAFGIGVEIEGQIFDSLVEEVMYDILMI